MTANKNAVQELQLPGGVVTRIDAGRLLEESNAVSDFLYQASVREPGTSLKLPKTSRLFDEMVAMNKLNLLQETDRQQLKGFLEAILANAPMLHMSFSADPPAVFTERLIKWLREQIHPQLLLRIGLQPGMGAGCVIRTTNKYYDFSLRQRFMDKREFLISQLHDTAEVTNKTPLPVSVAAGEPPKE